jgi:hypothetical protein
MNVRRRMHANAVVMPLPRYEVRRGEATLNAYVINLLLRCT